MDFKFLWRIILFFSMAASFSISAQFESKKKAFFYTPTGKQELFIHQNKVMVFDKKPAPNYKSKLSPYTISKDKYDALMVDKTVQNLSPIYSLSKKHAWTHVAPGGIIVNFKTNTDQKTISRVIRKYSIKQAKKLPIKHKIVWYFHTRAGEESLQLANQIHLESSVALAQPNWLTPLRIQ